MPSLSARCEDVLNEHHLMKKKALRKHLVRAGCGSRGEQAFPAPAGILISTFWSVPTTSWSTVSERGPWPVTALADSLGTLAS